MAWDTTSNVQGTNNVQQTQVGTSGSTGQNTQANQFTGGQTALQGQVPSLYSTLLQGQIPNSFTAPSALTNNYEQQFKNWEAPQIAVNGGAGSPMIAANQALGLGNLLANQWNQGVNQYQSALGAAGNYSLTPVGQQGNTNATGTSNVANTTNQQYNQNINQQYAAIQNILDILQQVPGPPGATTPPPTTP